MAAGRPTKYREEYCNIALKMCELGATENDIADALDVDYSTITRWKHKHPEFCTSLKVGRDPSDDRVEASLYKRATGYFIDSVKIFQFQGQELVVPFKEYVNPDTTAAIFWLKNRRPEQYRANPADHAPSITVQNIMPVPTAASAEEWEAAAKANQEELLKHQ